MKRPGQQARLGFLMATIIAIGIFLFTSCEKDSFNSIGFNSDFEESSSGLTMIGVGSKETFIRLSGSLFIVTGEIKVELIDQDGFIIYSRNFFAPNNYTINELFKASRGVWKLRYTSLEGSGSIDLHANYR